MGNYLFQGLSYNKVAGHQVKKVLSSEFLRNIWEA